MFSKIYNKFDCDTVHRMQAIFSSIFVLQNRMQTAGDKIQTKISMKQWLLIVMTDCCPEPRTLTTIGSLMGCSRQNVKKLALSLEKKGFINMVLGRNNSVCIELTEKANEYSQERELHHLQVLKILFTELSEEEIEQLFRLYAKLFAGVERVEKYSLELNQV